MNKVFKTLIFSFVFLILMFGNVFAENISLNISYGIENVAKNGNQLPLELRIQNKDFAAFNGYVSINVYESNKSVYVYKSDIEMAARTDTYLNKNVSITNRANTLIIEVYNDKEDLIITERTNIDLSYMNDSIIVGAITSDIYSLKYIDGASVYNNTLRVKLVQITEDVYSHNRNALDQLDALIISDIDTSKLSDALSYAINIFSSSGKPVFLGLGGKNGARTIPKSLYKCFSGPVSDSVYGNKPISLFDLIGGKTCYSIDGSLKVDFIKDNSLFVICSPLSFNDINSKRNNIEIFTSIVEKSFGDNRFEKIINTARANMANDYYNISSLLNIIDKLKLPDVFIITILLAFYVSMITVIIYVYLRNVNKRHLYGKYITVFAILFTIVMVYIGLDVMKKNTFLTYLSIVDIKNESTNETAFLNFRTSENGSYQFDTSENNKLYPIVKNTNEPILSANFIDMKNIKTTSFYESMNRTYVNVDNASDFDSNIFIYENNNYLNDVYNVECSVSRLDGVVSGRITNNMDISIKDASILMYGKVLKIGDIDANHSVSLSRAENICVPIGNNSMLAEILASGNNQNFLKYYLDENVYEYYDYAMLFGFLDNNGTIDINSTDVGDVYGKTLIVRRINLDKMEDKYDICALGEDVVNVSGYYEHGNNSINGDAEVINEYHFSRDYRVESIYFENLSSYDQGKLDFNVPFYGEITAYNIFTNTFDILHENKISSEELYRYLAPSNIMIIKYAPSSMDPLYRKICLPIVRAVAKK